MARGTMRMLLLLALCSGAMGQTFYFAEMSFIFPMEIDDFETSGTEFIIRETIMTLTVISVDDFSMVYEAQQAWSGWRRFFTNATSQNIRIDVSIKAANQTAANITAGRLTADAINPEFAKAGLPNITVLVPSFVKQRPVPVNLGTAGDFAILAKSGVSTVPDSVITGDVGVSPISRSAITGFSLVSYAEGTFTTSTQVTGKLYAASDIAPTPAKMTDAVRDMEIAYTDAAGRINPDHVEYRSGMLGGAILSPGVYKFGTNVGFSADCTISGSSQDTWIFQISGDMSIAANKKILLAGGAHASNIVWAVAGRTTYEAGSHFEGIILGATSAEFVTGSSINGRVLVQTAVSLQQTTVTEPQY
eukprot:CAMPEP_0173075688 /NCGR_PEP_ID=MMETSP1102-20130122/11838_1 /TAXON_ID=49646 /ORGANISM="Geminigera sp., Strain Caron Lab Isolate" /LENGTH=360 /DNA_ID=CAMNT_0013945149 /DNA_START=389 /DNA_END=1471 /DNA_ORIENTATION=+